jgi:hypothetical protein
VIIFGFVVKFEEYEEKLMNIAEKTLEQMTTTLHYQLQKYRSHKFSLKRGRLTDLGLTRDEILLFGQKVFAGVFDTHRAAIVKLYKQYLEGICNIEEVEKLDKILKKIPEEASSYEYWGKLIDMGVSGSKWHRNRGMWDLKQL